MDGPPVLLITGASSGVGAATAELAVEAGYRVALLARSRDRLEALAAQLGPERALPIPCDVREWDQQRDAVARTVAEFGRLDAAFANAGVANGPGFLDATPDQWRDTVLVNLYGVALTVRACLPALESSQGHLLLCSSMTARVHLPTVYSATKWGVTALGLGLRPELAAKRMRLTVIEPGLIDTDFGESVGHAARDGARRQGIEKTLAPADVASSVVYAMTQPAHVSVNEIVVRPTEQLV